jgi:hypothetical protein
MRSELLSTARVIEAHAGPVTPVWGAAAIAEVLGMSVRRAFDFLEKGRIPARRQGRLWQSTQEELHAYLLGLNCPVPAREAAGPRVAVEPKADVRRQPSAKRKLRPVAQVSEPVAAEPLA